MTESTARNIDELKEAIQTNPVGQEKTLEERKAEQKEYTKSFATSVAMMCSITGPLLASYNFASGGGSLSDAVGYGLLVGVPVGVAVGYGVGFAAAYGFFKAVNVVSEDLKEKFTNEAKRYETAKNRVAIGAMIALVATCGAAMVGKYNYESGVAKKIEEQQSASPSHYIRDQNGNVVGHIKNNVLTMTR